MSNIMDAFAKFVDEFAPVLAGAAALTGVLQVSLNRIKAKNASNFSAFRVTFFGPPQSGKTSAIIAILDYMVNSNMSKYLRLRGEATIESVERGALALRLGTFPLRTTKSSTSVYRFDYFPPLPYLTRFIYATLSSPQAYRVEIADFAGEFTDDFAEGQIGMPASAPAVFGEDGPSNYLKWIAESDRCLIFIDSEKYQLGGSAFADTITVKYIALWQRYLDLHSTKMEPRAGIPVVIVHSKVDLIPEKTHSDFERDFSKLYNFMYANSKDVKIFSSSVIDDKIFGNKRGIDLLADAMLPKIKILG